LITLWSLVVEQVLFLVLVEIDLEEQVVEQVV
jgi:hypothetical protein